MQAAEDCILRMAQLMTDHPEIQEFDINPLILYARGDGAAVARLGARGVGQRADFVPLGVTGGGDYRPPRWIDDRLSIGLLATCWVVGRARSHATKRERSVM